MTEEQRQAIIEDFIQFCKSELDIEHLPQIQFTNDRDWAVGHHSFGAYTPEEKGLVVYTGNRNLADTLRTLGHELVHHRQNELGHVQSATDGQAGTPIENQANALAGVLMRKYGKGNELIYEVCAPTLKQIYEAEQFKGFAIYCDMDGVLCNFDSRFEHYFGVGPDEYRLEKGKKAFNSAVDEAGVNFWAKMEPMPGAQELWSVIGKRGAKLLTSPGKYKLAPKGKKIWAATHLSPVPKDIIFRQAGEKHTVLQGKSPQEIKRSILIDDYYRNILGWKETKAIGLYYRSANQILDILAKFNIK